MYLLYILLFLLQTFIPLIYTAKLRKSNHEDGYEIMSRDNANMFLKRTRRGVGLFEEFNEECCGTERCDYEEVSELAAKTSWRQISEAACDYVAYLYSSSAGSQVLPADYVGIFCSGFLSYCPNYCRRTQFWCKNSKTNCVPLSYKCDSDNDCGNWEDEENCRISLGGEVETNKVTKLVKKYASNLWPISLQTSGILSVKNRPVCADTWRDENTKVICRAKFDYAGIWRKKYVGSLNYRMSKVVCSGAERHIGECSHQTRWDGCRYGVEIFCYDPRSLSFLKGNYLVLRTSTVPKKNVKVGCTQHFGNMFKGLDWPFRLKKPYYSSEPTFKMTCSGNEQSLADCRLDFQKGCSELGFMTVHCEKCSPDYLVSLIETISWTDTFQSLQNIRTKLRDYCIQWDCSQMPQEYPLYCTIKSTIDDIIQMSITSNKHIVLRTDVDYGKRLEHNYVKITTSELKLVINRVGDQVENSQQRLAQYFRTVAEFDQDKIEKDLSDLKETYQIAQKEFRVLQYYLRKDMEYIFEAASNVIGSELGERYVKFNVRMSAFLNPFESIFNTGDSVADAIDALTDLMNAGVKYRRLLTSADKLSNIKKIIQQINKQKKINELLFWNLTGVLYYNQEFNLENAKSFLDIYADHSPVLTPGVLAEFSATISGMVDTACDIIENAESVIGATFSLNYAEEGICPEMRGNIAKMFELYESTHSLQEEMIEKFANIARTKLEIASANMLENALITGAKEKVQKRLLTWRVSLALQQHKIILIKEACTYIQYKNHGREVTECKTLLENPNGDLTYLISYKYDEDMCERCKDCKRTNLDNFQIPAALSGGGIPVPKGTIDIQELYGKNNTGGTVEFTIPNNQWLVDNGWVNEVSDDDVFFVQHFQLFVPPAVESVKPYKVETTLTLMSNQMNGKSFMLPRMNVYSSYYENRHSCRPENKESNLYNPHGCDEKLNDICRNNDGNIHGSVYPSLVKSTWRLRLNSDHRLTRPSPSDKFYFIAKVQFCSTQQRSAYHYRTKRRLNNLECCHNNTLVTDLNFILRGLGSKMCQPCPPGSYPSLYGHYCQKCTAEQGHLEKDVVPSWPYGCKSISPSAECTRVVERTYEYEDEDDYDSVARLFGERYSHEDDDEDEDEDEDVDDYGIVDLWWSRNPNCRRKKGGSWWRRIGNDKS